MAVVTTSACLVVRFALSCREGESSEVVEVKTFDLQVAIVGLLVVKVVVLSDVVKPMCFG